MKSTSESPLSCLLRGKQARFKQVQSSGGRSLAVKNHRTLIHGFIVTRPACDAETQPSPGKKVRERKNLFLWKQWCRNWNSPLKNSHSLSILIDIANDRSKPNALSPALGLHSEACSRTKQDDTISEAPASRNQKNVNRIVWYQMLQSQSHLRTLSIIIAGIVANGSQSRTWNSFSISYLCYCLISNG